ncbi:MAG: G-D-S-L family lipolytic protein [Oscillatoriales cyanobacterium RM1_1_9]|nr:G-D-S-L family lipolytic protein [Oscillatoriales cyanobacterium SM2_3_0]NJO46003.1 G-D-S-L family lipolytic protein [Oscillatoriales cyanobacterium RM2_1_1]NJO71691.1 G-D-S-L family lipolytic protein [Oscillatoriales cyanobacterium RM1_1_9]
MQGTIFQSSRPWPRSESLGVQRHPLKLVALGDSVVYGYGDPEGGGWVERLRRQWLSPDSSGHVLYNLGVRGNRVTQVHERLEAEFRHRGELRNRVPDLIVLSVGLNDSARVQSPQGKHYTEFDRFQIAMDSLLSRAQQLCPVLFVGMVPVDEARMPFQGCLYYDHASQYRYKEATRLICMEQGIPYLDLFQTWLQRGEEWWRLRLCIDGLHPNSVGYQAILKDVLTWEPMVQLTNFE